MLLYEVHDAQWMKDVWHTHFVQLTAMYFGGQRDRFFEGLEWLQLPPPTRTAAGCFCRRASLSGLQQRLLDADERSLRWLPDPTLDSC